MLLPTRPTSASSDYVRQNQARALLYVANGLTTVRNMWGDRVIDGLAKEIDSGSALGPHIYSVGPLTDGNPPVWEGSRIVETRDQAEEAVRSDKQAGYIAIKVYNRLSKNAYEAIIAAARRQGLPVVGHVPTAVGLPGAIAARQDSIEHLTGFWQALQSDDSAGQKKSSSELLEHVDLNNLPALVQAIKAADVWNCPTLALHLSPRTDAAWLEEERLVPTDVLEPSKRMYEGSKSPKDALRDTHSILRLLPLFTVAALTCFLARMPPNLERFLAFPCTANSRILSLPACLPTRPFALEPAMPRYSVTKKTNSER